MAGFDHDALAGAMPWEEGSFDVLKLNGDTRGVIPERWWPIAGSSDPEERKHTAMAMWNDDFLELVPRFARALDVDLLDVRVVEPAWLEHPSLYYVVAGEDGYGVWTGEDPTVSWDHEPPLFESLPVAVRRFLREVHAGFTTWDRESCGLTPPSIMQSFDHFCNHPGDESAIDWFETAHPPPRMNRLLRITGRDVYADLLTSPDLPPGIAVTFYEPDYELAAFGDALDTFMMMPLEA